MRGVEMAVRCSGKLPGSSWIASARWRWPTGLYTRRLPARSGWCEASVALAPAALLPTSPVAMMSLGSTVPSFSSGYSARITLVAMQPAQAMRVAPFSSSAVQLGVAVDPFAQLLRRGVGFTVVFLVQRRVFDAEICRQIDDDLPQRLEALDLLRRRVVRQGQYHHVGGFQLTHFAELEVRGGRAGWGGRNAPCSRRLRSLVICVTFRLGWASASRRNSPPA